MEPITHLVEVSLKVFVDEGTYWPQPVQSKVAESEDPFKDLISHLAVYIRQSIEALPGLQFDEVSVSNLRTIFKEGL